MNLKRRTIMMAMGASALAMSALPSFAQDDVVTLRMHQFLPEQANVPQYILKKWIDDVETASDGRIKVEMFSGMALGGTPPELYDQAVDGVADIVWTLPGYTPGRFSETEVFELPFMMTNAQDTSRAYWKYGEEHLINDEMSDTHVLGLWVHGPGIIHSKEPIVEPGDLKGVKLRAPTRTTTMLFGNLGAEPIAMPIPAVPENLSKGVISATVVPWEVTPSLKLSELVTNHTTFPSNALCTAAFVFTMNKEKYDSLPDDLKKVIDDASGEEFSAFAGKTMEEYDAPGLKVAQEAGNNIIELTDEQIQTWKDASSGTVEGWIEQMNSEGFEAQALIDEAKKLIADSAM